MGARQALRWMFGLMRPERPFVTVALIYGAGVSILSLATPISVQMLINSVANTALVTPLVTLAGALFGLLLIAVLLSALRIHIMEMFARRFYARLVAEFTLRAVHARNPFFQDARREDLFNRYFDVVTVQKAVPSLLIGGFTIILQSAVGFAVTAFYHPFFLAFNLTVIGLAGLILLVWTRGAILSGIALSHAKYDAARWLENVGGSNGFYKSGRHVDYAMDRSEAVTARYIDARKRHFRYSFAQTVSFLLLYALASAGLLALGGWLVIQGELSIGQLVAAELILSAAFYGIGQVGAYLDISYDLIAAAEEVGLIFAVEQEEPVLDSAGDRERLADGALTFRRVESGEDGRRASFNFSIPSGARIIAAAEDHDTQRLFTDMLKRHRRPARGLITLGGEDVGGMDAFRLRSEVIVLDRPAMVDTTIRDFLKLANPDLASSRMLWALGMTGLDQRIEQLPEGLDTPLSSTGWPLSFAEVMQLKLAAALLKLPRVLVMAPLFDMLDPAMLRRIADELAPQGTTMIYFSHRNRGGAENRYLWLGREHQALVDSAAELQALHRAAEPQKHPEEPQEDAHAVS